MKKIILCLAAALLSCNCTQHHDSALLVKYIYHPYSFEEDRKEKGDVESFSNQMGLEFNICIFDNKEDAEGGKARLDAELNKPYNKIILFDPVTGIDEQKYINQFPDKLFVSFRKSAPVQNPNQLYIRYDKEKAFEKAGMLCALLIQENNEKLNALKSPGEKMRVGILTYNLPGSDRIKPLSFKKGFLSTGVEDDRLITEELKNFNDKNELLSKLDKLVKNGAVLIYANSYPLNSYCLDLITQKKGLLILEDWTYNINKELDDLVFLTIKDSFAKAVEAVSKTVVRKAGAKNRSWKENSILIDCDIQIHGVLKPSDETLKAVFPPPGLKK